MEDGEGISDADDEDNYNEGYYKEAGMGEDRKPFSALDLKALRYGIGHKVAARPDLTAKIRTPKALVDLWMALLESFASDYETTTRTLIVRESLRSLRTLSLR
ncbi:MAG TPA: hypothetical protein VD971_11920 [Phycisphaerales bacterium]|nr:hypothetical protein [Phycisphaerales bacterium]